MASDGTINGNGDKQKAIERAVNSQLGILIQRGIIIVLGVVVVPLIGFFGADLYSTVKAAARGVDRLEWRMDTVEKKADRLENYFFGKP